MISAWLLLQSFHVCILGLELVELVAVLLYFDLAIFVPLLGLVNLLLQQLILAGQLLFDSKHLLNLCTQILNLKLVAGPSEVLLLEYLELLLSLIKLLVLVNQLLIHIFVFLFFLLLLLGD